MIDAWLEIVGLEKIEEEYCHCAFCGCRLKYPVLVKRSDGTFWRVGRTCLGRVALELTGKEKTVIRVKGFSKYKEVKVEEEQPKVEEEEEEEDYFSLDDIFEDEEG